MSEHQITIREESALTQAPRPSNLLDIIAQAVMNPAMDVEKMERLLAMQERVVADERRIAFADALTTLQAECPQIEKDGRVIVKTVERSRYAKYETIDEIVRPLMAKHGFSISFDESSINGDLRTFSATLTHRRGHSEIKTKTMPFDKSEYRSAAQSEGSTTSYARRALLKMHLNLVERDEDTDGISLDPISDDQAKDLEVMMDSVKADKKRFLDFMGVKEVRDILVRDLPKAINALDAKRRGGK